jgi:hypothetical protein
MGFIFSLLGVLITVIEFNSGGNENSQIVILMTIPLLPNYQGLTGVETWGFHESLSLPQGLQL